MKVAVLTDPTVGGTFLSWSIYYLAGATDYWFYRTNTHLPLTANPLQDVNAHGFRPNQIHETGDLVKIQRSLPSTQDLCVLYAHPVPRKDTQADITGLIDLSQKILVMTVPASHHFYHYKYQGRTLIPKYDDPGQKNQSWDEQHEDFLQHYFGPDLARWRALGLTDRWDQREFLALNLRPYSNSLKITQFVIKQPDHFYLDARDAWFMLDHTIRDIMAWLDLEIDPVRYQAWQMVYQDWRTRHYNRVRFSWYFSEILQSILDGEDMDLERFDLDIVQEAIIQHELIYRHGLNFKTFGLERLTNTATLHDLLEPNLHAVESYA